MIPARLWQTRRMASNLAEMITRHAGARPDHEALVEVGDGARRALTWAEFDVAVNQSAQALDALGVIAGQRVMILGHNRIETAVAYYGALRSGVIAVPTNPGLTDVEVTRIIEYASIPVVLTDEPRNFASDPRFAGRLVEVDLASHRQGRQAGPVDSPPDPETLAAIVHTAGTSGEPKGVMLTHRALLAYCRSSAALGLADPSARVFAVLPLFHIYGLNAVLGGAVDAGATTVLLDGLPPQSSQIIIDEQITHLPLTPSALYRLGQDEQISELAKSVRFVSTGAAPMPSALAEHFGRLTGLTVEQGYGLTEAGPGISTTFAGSQLGPGHVGRAMPGVELRIGDGSEPEEPGELWVRGQNLFSGYWPDGRDGPDADGWFATGDVGYLHGEELFLVDRSRELVIVSGFNVYPTEIEELLEQHESVREAAVIGHADERTGERVVAFLSGPAVKLAEVKRYCNERLARYKVPSDFVVLKSLPRSATGKVRKGTLRDVLDHSEEAE